jgi:hydroxyacylglutathione hydrolase
LSNLKFALAVEPANQALQAYNQHCSALRQAGRPTLPSSISTEAAINPFLRSREKAVEQAVKHFAGSACGQSEVEVFAHLRQWKNEFK